MSLSLSEEIVQKVWEKGYVDSNNDPNVWRKGECGAWINRRLHGSRESEYGWRARFLLQLPDHSADGRLRDPHCPG